MKIPAANQVWASHYVVLCPQFLPLCGPGKCPRPPDAIEDSSRVSLFFRVDDLFEQFRILCKLCLMHFETVSDADWPRLKIAFLMHSCLRVSWFIKPNRFAGHLRGRAMWDAEPQKGSRKPRGSCKQTHIHTHLRAAVATPYRQQFDLLFTLNIFYFSSCGFTFNWHLISTGYSDFCAVQ